jgi:hypothetical protein
MLNMAVLVAVPTESDTGAAVASKGCLVIRRATPEFRPEEAAEGLVAEDYRGRRTAKGFLLPDVSEGREHASGQ